MPNTCRTDTFMSGKPAGSCALVMAAGVISPPRARGPPKPDLRWLRMGCCSEPIREQRPAEARGTIKVPLRYHQDRCRAGFWKAALRITPHFRRDNLPSARHASLIALFAPVGSYVRSAPTRDG